MIKIEEKEQETEMRRGARTRGERKKEKKKIIFFLLVFPKADIFLAK